MTMGVMMDVEVEVQALAVVEGSEAALLFADECTLLTRTASAFA